VHLIEAETKSCPRCLRAFWSCLSWLWTAPPKVGRLCRLRSPVVASLSSPSTSQVCHRHPSLRQQPGLQLQPPRPYHFVKQGIGMSPMRAIAAMETCAEEREAEPGARGCHLGVVGVSAAHRMRLMQWAGHAELAARLLLLPHHRLPTTLPRRQGFRRGYRRRRPPCFRRKHPPCFRRKHPPCFRQAHLRPPL